MTWKDSRWLLSIVAPAQPHFAAQRAGTCTLWGYALSGDAEGDYVAKRMGRVHRCRDPRAPRL